MIYNGCRENNVGLGQDTHTRSFLTVCGEIWGLGGGLWSHGETPGRTSIEQNVSRIVRLVPPQSNTGVVISTMCA